ncbi:hypothetical protein JCM19236_999 [Vibrio sp. JCM 19236]|nr:hypothetical protein JCM19236_999 [Vibrio sp. JCM 19236]
MIIHSLLRLLEYQVLSAFQTGAYLTILKISISNFILLVL